MWVNPDRTTFLAPKTLQDALPLHPGLSLQVSKQFYPQITQVYGTPGYVLLGVPRDKTHPTQGGVLCVSKTVASFMYSYVPYCCGVGLIWAIGTSYMNKKAWNILFNLVLPKNPHIMYLTSYQVPWLEGVGKIIMQTRNRVHDTVITHQMWTPPELENYFFDASTPDIGRRDKHLWGA